MDIALLNLANILHRSRHSSDALVALQVAVSVSPSVSVLQYALGNVYAVSQGGDWLVGGTVLVGGDWCARVHLQTPMLNS